MLKLFSPAKLNLFFRVLSKRADGFHEIASLFQALDFGDTLSLDFAQGEDRLECSNENLSTDSSNLVLRAARLFREKTGCAKYFSFYLDKKIPLESGLGGGSSNAATVLWGLNCLMNAEVDDSTLASWGAELGSDVPFFFSQGTAYCEGRGEIVTSVSLPSPQSFWLSIPSEGLSTPTVYRNMRVDKLSPIDPKESLKENLCGNHLFYNDLESAAFSLMPSLLAFKKALLELGFFHVHMSGSGSAFFCIGDPSNPHLPGARFFQTKTVQRLEQGWYKFP